MEKERSMKVMLIAMLLLLIGGVTVVFAVMSTQLQINGTATVDPAKWEIKFENLQRDPASDESREIKEPKIIADTTIGDFKVTLAKPGDTIAYTFDVFNNGSLDAEMESLMKATKPSFTGLASDETDRANDETIVSDNFSYTLKYTDDGVTVATNDLLLAGERRNMTLRLSYDGESLPKDDVEISDLGITITYVQR